MPEEALHLGSIRTYKVCFSHQAFSSLAEAAYDNAEHPDDGTEPETYCLSNYFELIVERLLLTAERWSHL